MARVVVFGTDRHAHIWSLRNKVDRRDIILATSSDTKQFLRGEKEIVVVTVSQDSWRPPTFPCEERVRETTSFIKERKSQGVTIKEVRLE